MNKEQFIKKWNVACDDLEQKKKMNEDLDLLIKRQTDLIEHLQKRNRIAETKNAKANTYLLIIVEEFEKELIDLKLKLKD
jgi:hypothetical protein